MGRIVSQAARMDRLLADLLDVARLESGRVALVGTPLDLVDLARSCTELAQMRTDTHTLRFETTLPRVDGIWDSS
jgi:signal transduction histidine kinase